MLRGSSEGRGLDPDTDPLKLMNMLAAIIETGENSRDVHPYFDPLLCAMLPIVNEG